MDPARRDVPVCFREPWGRDGVWGRNLPKDSFLTACKHAVLQTPPTLKHILKPVASEFILPPRRRGEG